MRMIAAVGGIVLLGCLAGCGGGVAVDQNAVRLTEASFGGSFTVPLNGTVGIALPENGSTGYSWQCTWQPVDLLAMVGDTFVLDPTTLPPPPGTGGTRCFRLRALAGGAVQITLQYGRWWPGGEREAAQTINLTVVPNS